MKPTSVRITGITIHNFKNVIEGSLSSEHKYRAQYRRVVWTKRLSKTALIDALELLKCALCGRQFRKFADFINVDSDGNALIRFTVKTPEETSMVTYGSA